ncbi:MAG: M3 family metallopeptidase [Methanobacteriota archaeon]
MVSSPLMYPFILIILLFIGGMNSNYGWQCNEQILPTILDTDSFQPLDLILTPGEIPSTIRVIINETQRSLDQIAGTPDEQRTIQNTLIRFEEIMTSFDDQTLLLNLVSDEYPDPLVASEARDGLVLRNAFLNKIYLRTDLAHALSVVSPVGDIEQTLKKKHLANFNLVSLPEESKTTLTMLGNNLSSLESEYLMNQRTGDASANLNLMARIITERQEIVSLLGYPSFTDYQIAQSGVLSDSEGIKRTLYSLSSPMSRVSHDEAAVLLKRKQITDPNATGVFDYEIVHLRSGLANASNQINLQDNVSDLFPVGPVIVRMNQVLSQIFGVIITPVTEVHPVLPDFTLYRMTDPKTGNVIAWFYLGIRSDEGIGSSSGKTYYLRAGREENGIWVPAVSAILLTIPGTNVTNQVGFRPMELQTLFHEYGHMLAHSLANGRYATLTSGAHEWAGYIEVPSLFLEQFFWTPEVLDQISGTKDGIKMTEMMRDQIIASRDQQAEWGVGYIQVYGIFLSLLDLSLYEGNKTPNFLNLYTTLYGNLTGYQSTSGGAGLLMNPAFFISGNAGMYWHYVLDDACAKDLFQRFRDEGILNERTGAAFRHAFFAPAGVEEPGERMRNFLGRDPECCV